MEPVSVKAENALEDFVITRVGTAGLALWDEARVSIFAEDFAETHFELFDGLERLHQLSEISIENFQHSDHPQRDAYRAEVTALVRDDFPRVRRRLIGKEPEFFSEIDRLRAEAELREIIALPIVALSLVVALREHVLVALIAIAIGAVLVVLLLGQARVRRIEAGDALVDALVIGRVEAPVLDKLEDELKTAVERVQRKPELARPNDADFEEPGDGDKDFKEPDNAEADAEEHRRQQQDFET